MVVFLLSQMAGDYLIGAWVENEQQRYGFYCGWSFGLSLLTTCSVVLRSWAFLDQAWRAAKKLHQDMIGSVLVAPVNLYFDVTPLGTILNKFSKDLPQIETQMGFYLGSMNVFIYTFM